MKRARETLAVDVAWAQIQGRRDSQQDAAAVTRWANGFHLMVLADGMGGHAGGGEASRIAVEGMKAGFQKAASDVGIHQRLLSALQSSNDAMFDFVEQHPELEGMGATVLAVTFDGEAIEWISVGDSPLWLLREGTLKRLNADHSMASELDARAARNEISTHEALASPLRSQLLSAVMGEDIERVDQPEFPLPLETGDVVILASDGVESLPVEEIARIAGDAPQAGATPCVDLLLAAITALDRPGQDNASVIMACVGTPGRKRPEPAIPPEGATQ